MFYGLLAFLITTVLLAFTPGPDILYVMTRSIAQGRLAGILAALGMATGCLFHTALAAAGISIIVAHSPLAFSAIKLLGACYLCWLAWGAFRAGNATVPHQTAAAQPLLRIYGQSILMNILNPKVMLFFLAYLVGFTRAEYPFPIWMQLVLLGCVFAVETVICFGTAALVAGTLTGRFRQNPRWSGLLHKSAGVVFLALAVMVVLQTAQK